MEKFSIVNKYGTLTAKLKRDLDNEEYQGYIPKEYVNSSIIELSCIEASRTGVGYGEKLIREFLSSDFVSNSSLVFLDPNPYIGAFAFSELSDCDQIKKLKSYYEKYGFKSNPKSNRMWLVRAGIIDINNLPL